MASPSPADMIIVNMNVGRHQRTVNGKKEEVSADERITAIQDVLIRKKPTLVFVQEFTWAGFHRGYTFNKLNIPGHYISLGNKKSSFIYDKRYLNLERLDHKSSLRRSYRLFMAQHSSEPYFDLSRLCICKIKSVGPPEFELLCVCWHGPHNNYKDPRKRAHLYSLLKFLLMIKVECGNLPLLLGGDFNLNSENVNFVCTRMSNELVMLQPRKQGSIMLWVQSNDFNKVFRLVDPNNDLDEESYPAFDHVVLTMRLQIATTVEDLKQDLIRLHGLCDYTGVPIVKKEFYYRCHLNFREMTETEDYPGFQMMSASWHGADAEYSDETKKESLKSVITFLQLEINKRFDPKLDMLELNWKGVLKDSSIEENVHSNYNILDTWIFSSNKTLLYKFKRTNANLKDVMSDLCNSITALIDMTTRHRHAPNASPFDIHLDIVNMVLSTSDRQHPRFILNGYLHTSQQIN